MQHVIDLPNFSSNYSSDYQTPSTLTVVSVHSGSFYPSEFLEKPSLAEYQFRYLEDAYVDQLIIPTDYSPFYTYLRAHLPCGFIDLNRQINEIGPPLFKSISPYRIFTPPSLTKDMRAMVSYPHASLIKIFIEKNTPTTIIIPN